MPVPDLCHGRVGQQQEHGTVSVGRTALRAASGL